MADKNRQRIKTTYSSSSSSARSQIPSRPFTSSKVSHPNSYSSRDSFAKEVTRSNRENADNSIINDADDGNQDMPTLGATCPFMCPEEEMVRRERLRDLAIFERLHGNPAKSSPSLAVKKFCRTITTRDVKAYDVRPIPVLEDTLKYLLNLLNSSECPFEVIHDFIFDRTRSIRQDLSMQNAMGDQVIHMYERMIKFHIVSHHHLHKSFGDPNIASVSHLNMEQLIKALTTLFNLYEANRTSESICKNESEFYSLYVLLHLGSNSQGGESLSLWLRCIPAQIIKSKEMSFARRMLRCFRLGNYKQFISTVEEEASNLQYCIIEPYLNEESDVESLCVQCGLEISTCETEKGLSCTKLSTYKPAKGFNRYYSMDSVRIERLCGELLLEL